MTATVILQPNSMSEKPTEFPAECASTVSRAILWTLRGIVCGFVFSVIAVSIIFSGSKFGLSYAAFPATIGDVCGLSAALVGLFKLRDYAKEVDLEFVREVTCVLCSASLMGTLAICVQVVDFNSLDQSLLILVLSGVTHLEFIVGQLLLLESIADTLSAEEVSTWLRRVRIGTLFLSFGLVAVPLFSSLAGSSAQDAAILATIPNVLLSLVAISGSILFVRSLLRLKSELDRRCASSSDA